MKNRVELRNALREFSGGDEFYRHALNRRMLYTQGMRYFAENAGNGAYWFMDIVATELMEIHQREEFMSIHLLSKEGTACIVADDGNGNEVYRRNIEYTDCPEGDWNFFLENNTLYLPRER